MTKTICVATRQLCQVVTSELHSEVKALTSNDVANAVSLVDVTYSVDLVGGGESA
jgi:hypothetical protein